MVERYNKLRNEIQELSEKEKIELLALWILDNPPSKKKYDSLLARINDIFKSVYLEQRESRRGDRISSELISNQNVLALFLYRKPTEKLIEAWELTIRDLKIAKANQTFMEFLGNVLFNKGIDFDKEIKKYQEKIDNL